MVLRRWYDNRDGNNSKILSDSQEIVTQADGALSTGRKNSGNDMPAPEPHLFMYV